MVTVRESYVRVRVRVTVRFYIITPYNAYRTQFAYRI